MIDIVNHPPHYNSHPSGIEAIELCAALDFCLGNAVKYLFRAGLKDPTLQDLKKAEWYLRHYASRHATATMACTEQTLRVLRTEKEGSVLGDTLEALLLGRVNAALNRVVREIAAVAP